MLEAFDACYGVTRPSRSGRAYPMVGHKRHLREVRKQHGYGRPVRLPTGHVRRQQRQSP